MIPQLAITMGDPAGIGPEIIVKACKALKSRLRTGALRLLVIGANTSLQAAGRALGIEIAIPQVSEDNSLASACLPAGLPRGQADSAGRPFGFGRALRVPRGKTRGAAGGGRPRACHRDCAAQ